MLAHTHTQHTHGARQSSEVACLFPWPVFVDFLALVQ
jgi:hypothetical protein